MSVLVGFADAFAAIESVWSLQEAGFEVTAISRRGKPTALRRVRGVRLSEVTAPEQSIVTCLGELAAIVAETRPAAFLPLDDQALWLTQRLNWDQCSLVGPGVTGTEWSLDKAAQVRLAERVGLSVPQTTVVPSPRQVGEVSFPRVLKPAAPVLQQGDRLVRPQGAVCGDYAELSDAISGMAEAPTLLQPLLTG
ncbi:MAG: hypothetical protein WCG47_30920, partial [Dermatophilaceae bacterium]